MFPTKDRNAEISREVSMTILVSLAGHRVCLGAEELEQWYADRRDFLAILPSHATRASRSPRFRLCSAAPRLGWNLIGSIVSHCMLSVGKYCHQ